MKPLFLLLCFLKLFQCTSKNTQSETKAERLRYTYNNLSKLSLPYHYSVTYDVNLQKGARTPDSLMKEFLSSEAVGAFAFRDTSHFFAFLSILPGDDLLPMLSIYDKKGNKLDSALLSDDCGNDCGYQCESKLIIHKDWTMEETRIEDFTPCEDSAHGVNYTGQTITIIRHQVTKNGMIQFLGKKVTTSI